MRVRPESQRCCRTGAGSDPSIVWAGLQAPPPRRLSLGVVAFASLKKKGASRGERATFFFVPLAVHSPSSPAVGRSRHSCGGEPAAAVLHDLGRPVFFQKPILETGTPRPLSASRAPNSVSRGDDAGEAAAQLATGRRSFSQSPMAPAGQRVVKRRSGRRHWSRQSTIKRVRVL